MLMIGAVSSVIGTAVALAIDWFPVQASTQAGPIDRLFDVLLIVSVPIFVLVEVVVLFSVWKFRMKPGEEEKDGPPIHGNTLLEVIWTAIPAILLVALCVYAYVVMVDIERKPADEMVVRVTGQQFAWTFEYPGMGPDGAALRSEQLYLPRGRSVEFHVRSQDVIHDFWVPAFRMKIDAVPGVVTKYRVNPTRLGDYSVVCAELCGLGHSTMRQSAHVLAPGRFQAWLARQRSAAEPAVMRKGPSRWPPGCERRDCSGRGVGFAGRHRLLLRADHRHSRGLRLGSADRRQRDHDRVADRRPILLPGRPGRVRLLVLLGGGAPHPAPRTTPATVPTRGATTSASTPTTR